MDADWDEVCQTGFIIPGSRDFPAPITALAFDYVQELLWVGNNNGVCCSFIGRELQRYTSFRTQPREDGRVRQILIHEKGIICLGQKTVHMGKRTGVAIWNIRHEAMEDLRCMSFTSKSNTEILVAGLQGTMFVIDVNKGEIVKQAPTAHHYTIMKKSRYICAATKSGSVDLLDPSNFNVVKTWQAHGSVINDMDAQGDYIVTCGASMKQQAAQPYMLDPYVNVFDLKNMTSMKPMPFPPLAAYVRFHPRMLTTSIVVSQHGQMHVVDLMNPNSSNVRYASIQYLSMFEIASSGEALAMAAEHNIHIWGSPSKIRFVDMGTPIELPTPILEPPPILDWSQETPLSSVGMPYYTTPLFSVWPENTLYDAGAPPVQIDPSFLSTLKKTEWGYYGRNTRGVLRNQFEDTRALGKATNALHPPKFLSEKARESMSSGLSAAAEVKAEQPDELGMESLKPQAPAMYRNLEIKYSKFGVDDFDFRYFNKTNYAGLENHITNCYANSLLQLMSYTPLLRNMALQHTATSCLSDPCMLCELGFVFDMLQKAEGTTCHATNLLKALSKAPNASQMGLLEDESHGYNLTTVVQNLTRFLLERVNHEYRSIAPASTALEQKLFNLDEASNPGDLIHKLLATSAVDSVKCVNCKNETVRPGDTNVIDLMYPPPKPMTRGGRATKTTFSQALKMGVERETTSKGWCSRCAKYHPIQMRKTIHSVPAVLAINTAISTPDHRRLWATSGFLPQEIGIIVEKGQFFCFEGEDIRQHLQRGTHKIAVYSLIGAVVGVESTTPQKPHLVATVNVAHSDPTPSAKSRWYLFNDFSVRSVQDAEALTFNAAWKMPIVLMYQLKSANNQTTTDWKTKLDTSVLYRELTSSADHRTCELLQKGEETLGPGSIVALDAEFVSLKSPEIQMNSDGEMETIRPRAHALARVSVMRGTGDKEGVPFIDDYIAIKETVVDYLTKFSGVTAADLDHRVSKHNLVSLKIAYKKLWVLLNLGCKFLGHGLKQDFRVINLQVPRAQVIDTIELFFLPARYRRLSLKWLAYHILREDVQQGNHDSVEDACTALKLYKKYQEFNDAGIFKAILDETYKEGAKCNFKPPDHSGGGCRTETPPIPAEAAPGPTTPLRNATSGGGFGVPAFTPNGKGR
ncbi:ubiquitin carboxyl-terminal hydrolase-domain-containing protein [Cercophora newfieldiana]|uniref:PAN2-PAN3 deadenylation complex catalytic subunit PAN2 n=1 Tax=Cercophora newfieldiana TaxID=92897 RepID=A0AA39XVM2_9PEZI|nr:ubiquitin carboxyl-terminal hydrolase-domain-containing protein [Cercophora newfieldiana]